MRFVPDWRGCWRWNSMHAAGLTGVLVTSWALLPDKLQDAIPHNVLTIMAYTLLAIAVVGRLRDQSKPKTPVTIPENKPCSTSTPQP